MSDAHEDRRGSAASRGYGHKWRQARAGWLRKHPLCVMCQRRGRVTPATVVDHKIPHRGDMTLFWDRDNWQSLCKPCHDIDKASLERGGRLPGCDQDGVPIDPNHHWR